MIVFIVDVFISFLENLILILFKSRTSKHNFNRWNSVLLMYQHRCRNSIWFVHSPRNCYFLMPSKLSILCFSTHIKVFRMNRHEFFNYYPTFIFYNVYLYISYAFLYTSSVYSNIPLRVF